MVQDECSPAFENFRADRSIMCTWVFAWPWMRTSLVAATGLHRSVFTARHRIFWIQHWHWEIFQQRGTRLLDGACSAHWHQRLAFETMEGVPGWVCQIFSDTDCLESAWTQYARTARGLFTFCGRHGAHWLGISCLHGGLGTFSSCFYVCWQHFGSRTWSDECGLSLFLYHLLLSTLGIAVGPWKNLFLEYLSIFQGHLANLGVDFAVWRIGVGPQHDIWYGAQKSAVAPQGGQAPWQMGQAQAKPWSTLSEAHGPSDGFLVFSPLRRCLLPPCRYLSTSIQLRQAANKALRCKHAGTNALLRFSLSDKMDADPGFFHLVWVIQTFRKVCGRSPRVLDCWRLWQSSFDGRITHGPFGVLLEVLNKVGWRVGIPPMVIDRNGHPHDLLLTPWMLLRHLLEDAWLCYVGSALTCSSMSSLSGIDGYVVEWGNSSLERSLQSALQSGAFMDAWTQGKFDVTKNKFCNQCHCPQTQSRTCVGLPET